ncbi:MAG: DUF3467 domain-containing protein [Phycisphaeraceae bacterium]|nr:MAG: DUF3467 domain-containing protein [Phycisphaeraceae bacterium]
MAEGNPQQTQQIQFRIDESKMHTTYSNTIRTTPTQEEMVLDFGMNIPMQIQGQAPMITFSVGSRVVMNWAGAKRLAINLGQLVRQFEERNGEIVIQQPQPQHAPEGDD